MQPIKRRHPRSRWPTSSRSTCRLLLHLALTAILTGCIPAPETLPPGVSSQSSIGTAPSPAPATKAQTATPTPDSIPTPAPQPVLVAVPERWMGAAARAIERLKEQESRWQWQLDAGGEPREKVEAGLADLGLIQGDEGVPAGQRPIALGVPFTSEWETIGFDQALEVLAQGSPFIAVMDWANMRPQLKALRVDGTHPSEAGYPLQQSWSLVTATGYEGAAGDFGPVLAEQLRNNQMVHLAAVGDIMLDRGLGQDIEAGGLDDVFTEVSGILQDADWAIGNLESALGSQGARVDKSYTFQAPPQAAQSLAQAGFDLLTLANNHAMDYGPTSLLEGIQILEEQGIATVGAGIDADAAHAPYLLSIHGIKIAFLAYVDVPVEVHGFDARTWEATPTRAGVAWADPSQMQADIGAIRPLVDVVVVLLHSGYEYTSQASPPQIKAAHAAVDAGADLVLGHHAHLLQGIEFYGQSVIVYGLGNFAFEDGGASESAILYLWLARDGVRSMEIVPILIDQDGRPLIAPGDRAAEIRALIYKLTLESVAP